MWITSLLMLSHMLFILAKDDNIYITTKLQNFQING